MNDIVDRDLFGEPVRHDPEAADRDQFVDWIVERYLAKGNVDAASARDFAEAFFDPLGGLLPEFGDDSHSWTRSAAYGLADEDMSYWEAE